MMFIDFKKIIHIIVLLLFMTVSVGVTSALALLPSPAPSGQDSNVYTFADMGVESDILLKGPYESTTIRFALPPTWQLQDGTEINLVVKSFFSTYSGQGGAENNTGTSSALLEVEFNRRLQQSIVLTSDSTGTTYRIPISVGDLGVPDRDGYYSIKISLDASIDCDLDFHRTTAVIGINSFAVLPHVETPLALDLRKLPWPFYQERAKLVGSSIVVIPSAPTEDEMQAGLVVMGTLGRVSQGKLPVAMITANQLTEANQLESDLIFVGKSTIVESLFGSEENTPIVNGKFSVSEVGENDGILQILPSPWNTSKTILVVSGYSDLGVVKAAQAMSTGNLQTGTTPDYSVIAQVHPVVSPSVVRSNEQQFVSPTDITFANLGYEVTTVDELGTNYLTYEFNIPQGQVPSENPYLELKFSNSTMIDPALSYISIYVNEIIIGSIDLSEDTSSLLSSKIDIPPSILRYGLNVLDLELNLIPRNECSILLFSGLWVTVYDDSFIHLPLIQMPETSSTLGDLKSYPYPFANDPSLGSTVFIVPSSDQSAWVLVGKIVYDLGARVNGSILSFETVFDNQIPENLLAANFIVVGEPKNLSVLEGMRSTMPAYFEPGSNIAVLESQLVVYKVSDQKSLGYLEIFNSPWNPSSAVLGVFGTNQHGLELAVDSLLKFEVRETMSGNFSTYDGGNRVIIVDTRTGYGVGSFETGIGSENITTETPNAQEDTENSAVAEASRETLSNLILVAIVGVIIAMVVVFVFVFRFRKKRS